MGKQGVNQFGDERECFARHMGVWAVRPEWMARAAQLAREGLLPLRNSELRMANYESREERFQHEGTKARSREEFLTGLQDRKDQQEPSAAGRRNEAEAVEVIEKPYSVHGGVAVVPILGAMLKGDSKWGGTTNTLRVRKAILQAGIDPEVGGIMLRIESPGGHVAGTHELGEVVAQSAKPVWAYIEDVGASAAYWVASQAQRVLANRMAEIGSIGVFAVVQDQSGLYQREGVKVHVVSSGGVKGMGAAGTEVKPEFLAELQGQIDSMHQVFIETVARGRKMEIERASALGDGRMHIAPKAVELGLADGVMSLEQAVTEMGQMVARGVEVERAKRRLAKAR